MFWLLCIYVFLIPLEYIHGGKIPKGPVGVNYQNAMLLAMLIYLLTVRVRAGLRERAILKSPLTLPLFLMLINFFFSLLWANLLNPELDTPLNPHSLQFARMLHFSNALFLFWLAVGVIHKRWRLNYLLVAIALSAPLVIRAFRVDLSYVSAWHYSHDMRVKGPFLFVGSNELGTYFLYSAIFFLLFALRASRRWMTGLFLIVGAGYTYGILYSYSRATQLAFIVGMTLAAVARYRALLLLGLAAWIASPLWLPASVIDRWEMTTDETGELDKSSASREMFWDMAIEMWTESPLIGHGAGSFRARVGMDTHGIYHRTLAEQGVVGFGIFMWMWAAALTVTWRLARRGLTPGDRQFGLAMLMATIALMVANIFGDRFTHLVMIGQYWVLMGLAARLDLAAIGVAPLEDADPDEAEAGESAAGAPPPPPRPRWSKFPRLLRPAAEAPALLEKAERTRVQEKPKPQLVGPAALPAPPSKPSPLNLVGRRD